MFNVGEELVAAYLEHIKECEFIQQNLYTKDVQGEIDVVGINLAKKELYVCEVAVHLKGIQYTKENRPVNESKLIEKFSRDIEYAKKYFAGYTHYYMLWTPVVRISKPTAKHNQMRDVRNVQSKLNQKYGIELELVINEEFYRHLQELREFARKETKALKSPIARMLQVEEHLDHHINKGNRKTHPRVVDEGGRIIIPPAIQNAMNIVPRKTWISFKARPHDHKIDLIIE